MSTRNIGPAKAARSPIRAAQISDVATIALLGWTNPDGPLLRSIHYDILIQDVCHKAVTPELHVDAFRSVMHMSIAEGDVPNGRRDRSNGEANTACVDTLDYHIASIVLDIEAIVL